MRRLTAFTVLVLFTGTWLLADQQTAPPAAKPAVMALTVDSIMRGPALVGAPPSAVRWSKDSSKAYFTWQKAGDERSSTYVVNRDGTGLLQLSAEESRNLDIPRAGRPDRTGRRVLTAESGDIVIYDVVSGVRSVLARTSEAESNPRWARNDTAVTFQRGGNLHLMTLVAGEGPRLVQLTDIVAAGTSAAARGAGAGRAGGGGRRGGGAGRGGAGAATTGDLTESQRLLREQELALIDYLRKQAEGRGGGRGGRGGGAAGSQTPQKPIARFSLAERQSAAGLQLSADERYVWISVDEQAEQTARRQGTPNYITQSSYPELIPGRANVGDVAQVRKLAVLDLQENKSVWADAAPFAGREWSAVPGAELGPRIVNWGAPDMSADGAYTVISVRAADNKDRWFVKVDPATGAATILDNQRDDAWIREQSIGGGGGGAGIAWLPDNKRFLFLSEKTGYLHLYSLDMSAPLPSAAALTSGSWEVTSAQLSEDGTRAFLQTNEVHPGERHFYTMSVDGGVRSKVTTKVGSNAVTVSPDERSLAVIHSYSNTPPELFMMPFTGIPADADAAAQVTVTPTDEWRAFKWIDPKIVTYKARDGQDVYARLFTPEMMGAKRDSKKPAVVFVHGAGYLQNAHKYWSGYYREYMFHHILASKGYVVLDPDYRASSGYGRDWRTGIYRFMGGKDLEDVVDGAKYLVASEKVDAKRIGVYGGSYGGFITLMALFTTPDVFVAGAALRPVTDWSHYNHGYTSNILNTPQTDPEAFRKSSPIFHAEGLKNRLLILHGMVDTNVFFQDSVRLAQRLIELRKENWELAGFPVESHGFTEETSWADEYKRILKLFETELRGVR